MSQNPITIWREHAGLTYEAAANLMGHTGKGARSVWRRWEVGINGVPLEVVAKVEALSEGKVTLRDWLSVRRAYKAAHADEKAAA